MSEYDFADDDLDAAAEELAGLISRGFDFEAADRTANSLIEQGLDPVEAIDFAIGSHDLPADEMQATEQIMARNELTG